MTISIILRSLRSSELFALCKEITKSCTVEIEIIAVCNINDRPIDGVRYITQNASRLEAKIIGVKNSRYDKILFIDSDQIPEHGLIEELNNVNCDMCIIPERFLSGSLTSVIFEEWKERIESYARNNISPFIPVIPRFYDKQILLNIIDKLPLNYYKVVDHEDSILFYFAFKESLNIRFSSKRLFNSSETLLGTIRKAFLYGKNHREVEEAVLDEELRTLITRINLSVFDFKHMGFGKGHLIQFLRAGAYLCGTIIG